MSINKLTDWFQNKETKERYEEFKKQWSVDIAIHLLEGHGCANCEHKEPPNVDFDKWHCKTQVSYDEWQERKFASEGVCREWIG